MEVMHFQVILVNNGMEHISNLMNDEKADGFMENIHLKTEERLCIHLNTPKENPRWKIVAERYGFSTSDINTFERAVEVYNLYSPTWRILNEYSLQFPREKFDKIREFLSNEL